jgi:oxalate decarboxylase/phosphoglucose isomerase-like protein (cupin superfamily)
VEKISRRNVIGATAAALAGGVLAGDTIQALASSTAAKGTTEPAKPKAESIYKFRMGEALARRYGDSSIREHKTPNFPISSSMAAALIRLAPGDFREPHWHPNSDEWLFVMSGTIHMTIVDGKGEASRFKCGPEDVAFTPQGFGHYVENIGVAEASLMVIHNNGDFSTVELSEWIAGGSIPVFASTLNMPIEAFDKVPAKRVFIGKKKKQKE